MNTKQYKSMLREVAHHRYPLDLKEDIVVRMYKKLAKKYACK